MSNTKRTGRKRATRRMGPPRESSELTAKPKTKKARKKSSRKKYVEPSYSGVQTMQGMDLSELLPAPKPLASGAMRLVALGGVSEIGRNMMTYEYDGHILICDCGVLLSLIHI